MGFWIDFINKVTNSVRIYENRYKISLKDEEKFKTVSERYEVQPNERAKENYLEKIGDYVEGKFDECKEKNKTEIYLSQNKIKKDDSLTFDKEAMRKAMIYSEILGKPKAKAKGKRRR